MTIGCDNRVRLVFPSKYQMSPIWAVDPSARICRGVAVLGEKKRSAGGTSDEVNSVDLVHTRPRLALDSWT